MVQVETITINGNEFIRTWSDAGYFIENAETGESGYSEAIDPITKQRTYVETDQFIDDASGSDGGMTEDEAYAQAGRILLGVEGNE